MSGMSSRMDTNLPRPEVTPRRAPSSADTACQKSRISQRRTNRLAPFQIRSAPSPMTNITVPGPLQPTSKRLADSRAPRRCTAPTALLHASAKAGARRRRAAHRGFDLAELVLDSCARDRADLQLDFPFELDDQRHLRAERGAGGARGAVCAAETWALARRRGIEDALFPSHLSSVRARSRQAAPRHRRGDGSARFPLASRAGPSHARSQPHVGRTEGGRRWHSRFSKSLSSSSRHCASP